MRLSVEKHLWTNAIPMARMIVDAQPFDYIVVVGEEGELVFQVVEGESEGESLLQLAASASWLTDLDNRGRRRGAG